MTAPAKAWAGEFGDAYTRRNRVDWQARIPFWGTVMLETGARSVYELGCNAGWNLSAIKREFPDVQLHGSDLNETAIRQARFAGHHAVFGGDSVTYLPDTFDLVFTAGVLIHIPPERLAETMARLVTISNRYVLAVEYAAPADEEIEYRGERGLLWRRPFGKIYEAMGLRLVQEWGAGPAFDRCTAWLLEKQHG